ncbi:hypothetical protein [Streptomyces sp. URMC 123]|uniref:hypothetical protein n=1 Tax=Streptomyces sp. URMC 123 TaxID=3423403 RepID=UPI003F1B97F1
MTATEWHIAASHAPSGRVALPSSALDEPFRQALASAVRVVCDVRVRVGGAAVRGSPAAHRVSDGTPRRMRGRAAARAMKAAERR